MFLSQVIGNLGSDVALMDGENGKKYATFSVAHTEYTKRCREILLNISLD